MAYKIVLDAGHGGTDPGAVYNGRNEKDDNLALAQAVGKILEDNGVDVVYTRTEDIYQTPFEKARIANQSGADYFISFHRNSSFAFWRDFPFNPAITGIILIRRRETSRF